MKKLQSNYTTIDQSKQLLELGLSSLTADSCVTLKPDNTQNVFEAYITIPIWSVGRLIEIMNICSICGHVSIHRTDRDVTQIEQLIEIIQNRINDKTIDFSKIELD
jgi:hypothetical protein